MKQTRASIPSFPSLTPRSLFLPISLTHIHCLQGVAPLTRHFTSSLQLLISKNGICFQVGAVIWRWRTGTGSLHMLSRQLQGKHKLRRNGICGLHTQGSLVKMNCCDKVPSDPEIANIRTVRPTGYYLFWWDIAPRLWACSRCFAIEFSLAGRVH